MLSSLFGGVKSCRLSIKDHCVLCRRMFYLDTLNVPSMFYTVEYWDSADFKWNLWGTLERMTSGLFRGIDWTANWTQFCVPNWLNMLVLQLSFSYLWFKNAAMWWLAICVSKRLIGWSNKVVREFIYCINNVIQVYCEPTSQQHRCFTFGGKGLLDWVHSLSLLNFNSIMSSQLWTWKRKVFVSQSELSKPAEVFCGALSSFAIFLHTDKHLTTTDGLSLDKMELCVLWQK